jgi:hypothetical protein
LTIAYINLHYPQFHRPQPFCPSSFFRKGAFGSGFAILDEYKKCAWGILLFHIIRFIIVCGFLPKETDATRFGDFDDFADCGSSSPVP